MRHTVEELERRLALEATRDRLGGEIDRARARLAPLEAQRAEAGEASRTFDAALSKVYRDPAAARDTFEARAREQGDTPAAAELRRHPERFGELRGKQVGPVRSEERREALRAAADLEGLGTEHLRGARQVSLRRGEYGAAKAAVVDLETRMMRLDAELARRPGSASLRHTLDAQLRALRPAQRNALHRSLPIPQRRLVAAAVTATRSFAYEQGHER